MVQLETIKLDIDTLGEKNLLRLAKAKAHAWSFLHPRSIKIWATTKGYHIEAVVFFPWDIETIPLWQLYLGSDFWREVKNTQRIKHKVKNWNVLFQVKNGVVFKRQRKLEQKFLEELIWLARHKQV